MLRRPFLRAAGLSALGGLLAPRAAWSAAPTVVGPRDAADREAWSFVLLPDTQCYSETYPEVFRAQTEWIIRQRYLRNIRFVLHLGDITNNNVHGEWMNARVAMDTLRLGGMPHLLVPGNHDLGPWGNGGTRASFFSDWFIQRNARRHGESENAFLTVTVGDAKFLIVGLEFGPRAEVVAWANEVVARHPDHHAILLTHAYLYSDGTRYDWGTRGREQTWNPNGYGVGSSELGRSEGVHDGEALWQQLVRRHPQFAFTFNGHVLHQGVAQLASPGDAGNTVQQVLVNYQCGVRPDRRKGGGGFLRLVEVAADGHSVTMQDYSPYYDEWLTEPDRRFTLTLDRDLGAPFAAGG
jgi:hypothetical protein